MAAATVGQECRNFRIVSSSSRRASGERVESWPSSFSRTSHFSSAWRASSLTAVSAFGSSAISARPQSSRAVASGQSGIVIFVIHCLPLSSARSSIARWNGTTAWEQCRRGQDRAYDAGPSCDHCPSQSGSLLSRFNSRLFDKPILDVAASNISAPESGNGRAGFSLLETLSSP